MSDLGINIDKSLVTTDLMESRMKSLEQAATSTSGELTAVQKAEYEKAARGFESMFVNMMFKQMKQSQLGEKKGTDEFGGDTLSSYTDMLFADQVSKTGKGIGIAEMLYETLTGGEKLQSLTSKTESSTVSSKNADLTSSLQSQIQNAVSTASAATNSSFLDRVSSRISQYDSIINEASQKYGVPTELIKAVITAESAGKSDARSSAGAKGLMQLMDGTAKSLGVQNSYDPRENIMGGTRYLRQMLDRFGGNLEHALAGYNAGPGNVEKYNGVPPFVETKGYVKKVANYYDSYNNTNN